MPAYRSTALKQVATSCPRALDYTEAAAPYDRRPFAHGIAAHAIAQAVGEAAARGTEITPEAITRIGDAVVRELVTKGRSFDGVPEPPMPIDAAVAGRDLAFKWLAQHPPSPAARFEVGLAVNSRWEPVAYDAPNVHYRAVLDVLEVIQDTDEDGYSNGTLLVVEDYKSAPPTDASELETVQLRGQLAVALAHYPNATIGRRSVVNFWRARRYSADLLLDDQGLATIEQWRRDIDHAIAAADARDPDGRRKANPGAGCVGCGYVLRCDAAREVFRGTVVANAEGRLNDADTLGLRYAVARGISDALGDLVREAVTSTGPVKLPDGRVIGYQPTTKATPKLEAARALAMAWHKVPAGDVVEWAAKNASELGLLAALKLGAANLNRAVTKLIPYNRGDDTWKERRATLLDALVEKRDATKFGIYHPSAAVIEDDGDDEESA